MINRNKYLKKIKRIFQAIFKKKKTPYSTAGLIPETIDGILHISFYDLPHQDEGLNKIHNKSPYKHRHVWVNGPTYSGMEDNDLRGFLDGRFNNRWNQPGQIHVRPGRRQQTGESELFRVLQRWTGIELPEGAEVDTAQIEIDIEERVDRKLEILLYEVLKDWNPGEGGIKKNNNSVPALGEVWWNEAMHSVKNWGLPGVGFASNSHQDADTHISPLAIAKYNPGDSTITFESKSLASYIQKRIRQKKPLQFLIKLSDYLEDINGTRIKFYSGNYGDSHNSDRRPKLILTWRANSELAHIEKEILLEYGRTITFPNPVDFLNKDKIGLAMSFKSNKNVAKPRVSLKKQVKKANDNWILLSHPTTINCNSFEIKVDSNIDPVIIGEKFTAELKDTWITSGLPEHQNVIWTFISPSGQKSMVNAQYAGDYIWTINFMPEELGRWQFKWSQNFLNKPHESTIGEFDVVPGNRENLINALKRLKEDILSSKNSTDNNKQKHSSAYYRLQRAILSLETPNTFHENFIENENSEVKKLFDELRNLLNNKND